MPERRDRRLVQITVTAAQLELLDEFQKRENLPSRAEALSLLLEIALDTVTTSGRRFWDRTH